MLSKLDGTLEGVAEGERALVTDRLTGYLDVATRITSEPPHHYTQRLFMSAPVPDPGLQRERRQGRRQLVAKEQPA